MSESIDPITAHAVNEATELLAEHSIANKLAHGTTRIDRDEAATELLECFTLIESTIDFDCDVTSPRLARIKIGKSVVKVSYDDGTFTVQSPDGTSSTVALAYDPINRCFVSIGSGIRSINNLALPKPSALAILLEAVLRSLPAAM
jgi:hypothetical protein